MKNFRIFPVFLSLIVFSSCYNEIEEISGSMKLNPTYLFPIGDLKYDINSEMASVIQYQFSSDDSVSYNGITYPIPETVFFITKSANFNSQMFLVENEKIKSLVFRLIIDNYFPTKVEMMMAFTDESNYPVSGGLQHDTIFIEAAEIDGEGYMIRPATSVEEIFLSSELIENMPFVRNLVVIGKIYLVNPSVPVARFDSLSSLNIHIGARMELEYDTDEIF